VNIETTEALYFDERGEVSLAQLIEISGLTEADLRELVDYGALAPVDPAASSWTFDAHSTTLARTARRLRSDLELDTHALSLILTFIERIDALESELRALRARAYRQA
jgi:chaperone modulatory protein CbpM